MRRSKVGPGLYEIFYCASSRAKEQWGREGPSPEDPERERSKSLPDEGRENDFWKILRGWLDDHPLPEERRLGVACRGEFSCTALHLACQSGDAQVVRALIDCAPEVAAWEDDFKCIPLHYACANSAPTEVVALLLDAFPDGRVAQNDSGKTPLHFWLEGTRRAGSGSMAEGVRLLSGDQCGTVPEACPDENGMLPIHYACIYGADEDTLAQLKEAMPKSLVAPDRRGQTPLHLAMKNAHRPAAPSVVRFLLREGAAITIGITDEHGNLPLHVLAEEMEKEMEEEDSVTHTMRNMCDCPFKHLNAPPEPSLEADFLSKEDSDLRRNVCDCVVQYLDVPDRLETDILSALRMLPSWVQVEAFKNPGRLLQFDFNQKSSEPFPTMILLLDFSFWILLIVFFHFASKQTIDCISSGEEPSKGYTAYLAMIFICGTYFLLRGIMQIISLKSACLLKACWLRDETNLINMICIVLTFMWGGLLTGSCASGEKDWYRAGMAFTSGLYWFALLMFLRMTCVDFAVFMGGMFHVMRSLAWFLISLSIVLVAFAQMFYLAFRGTTHCTKEDFPFCTFRTSLLQVVYVLAGAVEANDVAYNTLSTWLYCTLLFLVVILLANMLIAIVTEAYIFVKDQNAPQVFWWNRFAFLVEVHALKDVVTSWRKCWERQDESTPNVDSAAMTPALSFEERKKKLWGSQMDVFEVKRGLFYWNESFISHLWRVYSLVMVTIWFLLGLVSAGFVWPPQVRDFLLQQNLSNEAQVNQTQGACKRAKQIQGASTEKQPELNEWTPNIHSYIKRELEQIKKDTDQVKKDTDQVKKDTDQVKKDTDQVKKDIEDMKDQIADDISEIKNMIAALVKKAPETTVCIHTNAVAL